MIAPASVNAELPLAGVTVVDFTQVYLGPSCTQLLGDFGADVIKVERPGTGDLTRTTIPDRDGLDNPIFLSINRNKRSICVDTRTPEGIDVIRRLVRDADVVVSNFRSGVMDRIGLGFDALTAINPRLVWASGTGFGETGPYAHKGGQDVIAQAYSGVMWRRESLDTPLTVYPTTICDYITGMHLMQGILLALLARERTGAAQRVDISMYDSMLHLQMQEATMQMTRGYEINWSAMPLTGVFATKDAAVCMVGGFKTDGLSRISRALELGEDLAERPEFGTLDDQFKNRPQLQAFFERACLGGTTEHWVQQLEAEDILCAPVHSLAQALADRQTSANEMVLELDHPSAGRFSTLATPIKLASAGPVARRPPPRLGEHTRQVLSEHGFADDLIDNLLANGVLQ